MGNSSWKMISFQFCCLEDSVFIELNKNQDCVALFWPYLSLFIISLTEIAGCTVDLVPAADR